jgi:hypothetical protein
MQMGDHGAMTWDRVRAGLVSGIAGFAPLLLVIILTQLGMVGGDGAVTLALLAFPVSILFGGALAGYLAGQGKRRRSEFKVVVGGTAGFIAAALFGVILETLYIVRSSGSQGDALAVHPIRVAGAIVLLCALMVAVAMVTTQLTAKPLPPPRRTRKLTAQMPAVPPNSPRDTRTPVR